MNLLFGILLLVQILLNLKKIKEHFQLHVTPDSFNSLRNFKCVDILVRLNFLSLHVRRRHLDSVFLINTFKGKIACPSILDSVGLRIPSRSIKNDSTFYVNLNSKASPSPRCVSAANAVYRNIDIFNPSKVSDDYEYHLL
jgi:hypothetical protein